MANTMPLPIGDGYIPLPTPSDVTARQSISQRMIYPSIADEMALGAVSSRKAPAPSFAYPGEVPPLPILSPRGIISPVRMSPQPIESRIPVVEVPRLAAAADGAIRKAAELIVSKTLGKSTASEMVIPTNEVLEECLVTPIKIKDSDLFIQSQTTSPKRIQRDVVAEAAERIVEEQKINSLITSATAVQREIAIENARDVAASGFLNARVSELETEDLLARHVKRHEHEREQKDRAISRLTSKVVELEGVVQVGDNNYRELEDKIKSLLDVHGEKVLALQEEITILKAGQHTTTAHSIVKAKETELQDARKKLAQKGRQLSDMMIQLREVERKLDTSTLEHKPIRQALELAGHRYKEAEDARRILEESSLTKTNEIVALKAEVASLRNANQTAALGKEMIWKNWAEGNNNQRIALSPEREVQALRIFALLNCQLRREIVGRLPLPLDISEFIFRELKSTNGIVTEDDWLQWITNNDTTHPESNTNLLHWLGLQLRSITAVEMPSETVDLIPRNVEFNNSIVSSAMEERLLVCHINLASPTTFTIQKSYLLTSLPAGDHYLLDGLSDSISQREWLSWFASLYAVSNEEGLRMLVMLEAI